MPPEGTPYPFIFLADFQQIDEGLKDVSIGEVHPVIHIYGLLRKRGTVSAVSLGVKQTCIGLKSTDNFTWHCRRNMTSRSGIEDEGNTRLNHVVLEPTFEFS